MRKFQVRDVAMIAAVVLALPLSGVAEAVDWDKVAGKDVAVFYPGQPSWEWILTQSDHDGAKDIRKGKVCWDCHEGEENDIGTLVVSGKKLEPNPVAGRRGAFVVNVKAAHDSENLHIRLSWPDSGAGVDKKEDPDNEAKATVLIADDSIVAFQRGGCWAVCHDDLDGMPSDNGKELTKYLTDSRTKITRKGGGESYKSDEELSKLLAGGTFVELWQAHLNRNTATPVHGYILDKRHESDSPAVSVEGGLQGSQWVVVFTRKLNVDGRGRRSIESGKVYPIGIAIHDAFADGRHHQVSFKRTLSLDGGDADIVAVKQ